VPNGDVHRTRSKLEAFEDFSTLKASDLKLRIEEMLRIKGIFYLAVLILVTEWQGVKCIDLHRMLVGKLLGTGIRSCLVVDFGFGLSLVEYLYSGTTDLVNLGKEAHVFK
jgi:hypothetical protein